MQWLLRIFATLAAITAGLPAYADGKWKLDTIADLRTHCAEWNNGPNKPIAREMSFGFCIGVFVGFANGYNAGNLLVTAKFKGRENTQNRAARTGNEDWCAPWSATPAQYIGIFMKWSESQPARWHEYYGIGIVEALKEAWPCP